MADRKSFLLRIDAEVLDAVQRWANDDLRSLNGQIEFLLRKVLKQEKRLGADASGAQDGREEEDAARRRRVMMITLPTMVRVLIGAALMRGAAGGVGDLDGVAGSARCRAHPASSARKTRAASTVDAVADSAALA